MTVRMIKDLVIIFITFLCITNSLAAQIWLKPIEYSVQSPTYDGSPARSIAQPQGMAFDGDRLFIALSNEDAIGVYRYPDFDPIARWPVPGKPQDILRSGHGWLVPVFDRHQVYILNHRNGFIEAQIPLGAGPKLFSKSDYFANSGLDESHMTDKRYLLVSHLSNEMTVFDLSKGIASQTLKTGKGPASATFDISGNFAFVPLKKENGLEIINLDAGARVDFSGHCQSPEGGDKISGKNRYIIACSAENKIRQFLFEDGKLIMEKEIEKESGDYPFYVLIEKKGRYAFVSNKGSASVSVIDLPSFKLIHDIKTGAAPGVMRQFKNKLYIANQGSGTITVQTIPVSDFKDPT